MTSRQNSASGMFRSTCCRAPGHIALERVEMPPVDGDRVRLRIICCGVCGSDIAAWQGSGHVRYPYSPGHEFCGVVEEAGANTQHVRTGQRVVVNPNLGCGECFYCRREMPNLCDQLKTRPIKSNGGFSEYVVLDHRMVHELPDSLPSALATFVEPLSCGLHVARKTCRGNPERVAIFGAGTMGLMAGIAVKPLVPTLIFVEPDEQRRKQVSDLLGLPALSPRELQERDGAPLDAAVDCSGSAAAIGSAIHSLRKAGRLVMAGLVRQTAGTALPLDEVTTKELELTGAWLNPNVFEDAIELTVQSRSVLEKLAIRGFALDDVAQAFECARTQETNKVVVWAAEDAAQEREGHSS